MTYRVEIIEDEAFDPRNPPMHPELISDYEIGRIHPYEVALQMPPSCGIMGHAWDDVDSIGGVLLNSRLWAGTYTHADIAGWTPRPDVNHLVELIEGMLQAHGINARALPVVWP
jgi:hypothetical protein